MYRLLDASSDTHVLGLLNHASGEHGHKSASQGISLWYILPALLHSQDGRAKRRERFVSVELVDITLLLP